MGNAREDFSLCLKCLRGILPVLHQQKLCGGSDGNAVEKSESGEGCKEGCGGGPGAGEQQARVKKWNAAISPKTTCQSTSASTLLNEAELLHFTYNQLNNRVMLSVAYKHSHKSRLMQSQPVISNFTSKLQYVFPKQWKLRSSNIILFNLTLSYFSIPWLGKPQLGTPRDCRFSLVSCQSLWPCTSISTSAYRTIIFVSCHQNFLRSSQRTLFFLTHTSLSLKKKTLHKSPK